MNCWHGVQFVLFERCLKRRLEELCEEQMGDTARNLLAWISTQILRDMHLSEVRLSLGMARAALKSFRVLASLELRLQGLLSRDYTLSWKEPCLTHARPQCSCCWTHRHAEEIMNSTRARWMFKLERPC